MTAVKSRVTADQFHMTVSQAQVSTHQGYIFSLKFSAKFELIAGPTSSGFLCHGYRFIVLSKLQIILLTGTSPLMLTKLIYQFLNSGNMVRES